MNFITMQSGLLGIYEPEQRILQEIEQNSDQQNDDLWQYRFLWSFSFEDAKSKRLLA